MPFDTKTICRLLQNANRPELAKILGEVWETPLLDYADQLWEKPVALPPFEIELREAFETEFCRIGYTEIKAKAYSTALDRTRVFADGNSLDCI